MSKVAPLEFPKKGEARPPADAAGRAAETPAAPAPVAAAAPPAVATRSIAPAAEPEKAAPAVPFPDLEGRDDPVQINVTVPRWVRSQLKMMTVTGQAKSIKEITTNAIIRAVEDLAKGRAAE